MLNSFQIQMLKPLPKHLIYITGLILISFISGCANLAHQTNDLKIMSFNIRCGVCEEESDPNHWSKRKFLVAKLIKPQNLDIIAIQEADDIQTKDMAQIMNYSYYGIGSEKDGTGSRNAILWNPNRFDALETQTIWLNPTFKKFELGWDADWVRTLTMIEFKDKVSQKSFWVFNAHLDNAGKNARFESAKIILNLIKAKAPQPVILIGDFNDIIGSQTYALIAKSLNPISNFKPDDYTYNGFGKDIRKGYAIDHIFTNFPAKSKEFNIINTTYDGLYPSDHFPIIARVRPH